MIKNYTFSRMVFFGPNGERVEIPPEPIPARADVSKAVIGNVRLTDGVAIPLVARRWGREVVGLPEPEPGRLLIVSAVAYEGAERVGRPMYDLVVPDDLVRDQRGHVLGARALSTTFGPYDIQEDS